MIRFLEKYVMPVAGKVAEQRHLQAIRDGIILTMPFLIIGSFFLIISALPIPGYNEFMAGLFGENWQRALGYPVSATFNIMALIAVFGIAYRLGEYYKVDALASGGIVACDVFTCDAISSCIYYTKYKRKCTCRRRYPSCINGKPRVICSNDYCTYIY